MAVLAGVPRPLRNAELSEWNRSLAALQEIRFGLGECGNAAAESDRDAGDSLIRSGAIPVYYGRE